MSKKKKFDEQENDELLIEAERVLDADEKLIEQKEAALMETKSTPKQKENLEKSKKLNKAFKTIIRPLSTKSK